MAVAKSRVVVTQFCDDIRHELGNKFSLMGCYLGGELIIDKLPAALPRLCAQVTAVAPLDQPFEKLTLQATLNDETIAVLSISEEMLSQAKDVLKGAPAGATNLKAVAFLVFSPLYIEKTSVLKIKAETEDGELSGGLITLRERTADDPQFVHPALGRSS